MFLFMMKDVNLFQWHLQIRTILLYMPFKVSLQAKVTILF